MNKENLTKHQLIDNKKAAANVISGAIDNDHSDIGVAFVVDYVATSHYCKYWLGQYFKYTGESLAVYELELELDNSFREVGNE